MKLPQVPGLDQIKIPTKSSKNTDQDQYYTVVDVGASAVRAAIIQAQSDGIHVLGYGYVQQPSAAMNAGLIANLSELSQTIDQAVTKAVNQAGVASEQLILGLGGVLVQGVSTLARLNRPDAKQKIDKKELQLILERVAQNVLLDNQNTVAADMAIQPDQVRLVNAGITSFTLDGYRLATPLDFSGKEIEVCLFTAYVAESTIVALQQILDLLGVDLTTLTSEPYALAEIAISVAPKPQQANAIVIDVGSGTTSVTLIENGAVANSRSFPVAGRAITARLADAFKLPMAEAEKLKLDYTKDTLVDSQLADVRKIIKDEVDIWLHSLSIALSQLGTDNAFPDLVYLCGGASALPDIHKSLSKDKLTKALGFSRQPTIETLSLDILPNFYDQTKQLSAPDLSLAALSLFWLQRQQEDSQVAETFRDIISQLK